MTDIKLDSSNDLAITGGQLVLIETEEELVRQKLLNKLRCFTGTLFTNINYGIRADLLFKKGTQTLLDQNIKTLISRTTGIVKILKFESTVGVDRVYRLDFEYQVESGDIVGISGLGISVDADRSNKVYGIWEDSVWNGSNYWDDNEIWGGDGTTPLNALTLNGLVLTLNGQILTLN